MMYECGKAVYRTRGATAGVDFGGFCGRRESSMTFTVIACGLVTAATAAAVSSAAAAPDPTPAPEPLATSCSKLASPCSGVAAILELVIGRSGVVVEDTQAKIVRFEIFEDLFCKL